MIIHHKPSNNMNFVSLDSEPNFNIKIWDRSRILGAKFEKTPIVPKNQVRLVCQMSKKFKLLAKISNLHHHSTMSTVHMSTMFWINFNNCKWNLIKSSKNLSRTLTRVWNIVLRLTAANLFTSENFLPISNSFFTV